MLSILVTVAMGVDRAHAAVTDATMYSPLLTYDTTCRAAASDATGLSPLLAACELSTNTPHRRRARDEWNVRWNGV